MYFDTGKPSQGAAGQNANPLTVANTEIDKDGNTVIIFSDHSKVIVNKGLDAVAPTITIGTNGNWLINGIDTGKPSQGLSGKDGLDGKNAKPLVITAVVTNDKGDTVVTFSDKTSITIQKGIDGKSAEVSIGTNGNWVINGIDTGKSSKGENAKPLTIEKTALDAKGNTIITFSDNSKVTIVKGENGKTPVVSINDNGYWVIDGVVTKVSAKGKDGVSPTVTIGENGHWIVDGRDTGIGAGTVASANGSPTVISEQKNPITAFVKDLLPKTGDLFYTTLSLLGTFTIGLASYLLGRFERKKD